MKKMSLASFIFLAMALGILTGFFIKVFNNQFLWLYELSSFCAEVFLRLLKMILVPLVITSIVTGVMSVGNSSKLGRIGIFTFLYYLGSSLLAILTGLLLVNILQPGVGVDLSLRSNVDLQNLSTENISDIFIRMIPLNFFDAAAKGQMLPVIFFCIVFAFFLNRIQKNNRNSLQTIFMGCFEVMMKMTQAILYLAPIGIWGLFTQLVYNTGFNSFYLLVTICFVFY